MYNIISISCGYVEESLNDYVFYNTLFHRYTVWNVFSFKMLFLVRQTVVNTQCAYWR